MYGACRAWIKTGCLPLDQELRSQLLAITYSFNVRDEILLTSKEVMMRDGKPSPDDLDALVLTFAHPLAPRPPEGHMPGDRPLVVTEYDPFAREHMEPEYA
jgi:hypothetical protein